MPEETIAVLRSSVGVSIERIAELVGAPITWSYHEGATPKLTVEGVATLEDLDEYTDITWHADSLSSLEELDAELTDLLHTLERVAIVAAREFVAEAGGTYAP